MADKASKMQVLAMATATLFDSMIIIMMMMQKIVVMTICMNQSMQAIDNCLHGLIHTSGHQDNLLHHHHDYDHAVKQGSHDLGTEDRSKRTHGRKVKILTWCPRAILQRNWNQRHKVQ